MALTVCYALLGSMLLALTLIPALATYLFRHGSKEWRNPVLIWLEVKYAQILKRVVVQPKLIVLVGQVAEKFVPNPVGPPGSRPTPSR